MLNKHLLKFGVNGGEGDREKKMWAGGKSERLAKLHARVCVYPLVRQSQGH